jgi:hypothetical protein
MVNSRNMPDNLPQLYDYARAKVIAIKKRRRDVLPIA